MSADPSAELDLDAARAAVAGAGSLAELDDVRRDLIGKSSVASRAKQAIKDLPGDQKPVVGKAVSEFTAVVTEAIDGRARSSSHLPMRTDPALDLTLGGHGRERGHLHLVTQCQRELEDVFVSLGYKVEEGPEVEDDWHNFEALNFPPGHPARAMQDTLYVDLGEPEQVLLRTHTSPVQIRVMETQKPPIYSVMPGRTYRNETLDARHSPVFHQIEGLAVDHGITFGDLAGTLEAFTSAYFGKKLKSRLHPVLLPVHGAVGRVRDHVRVLRRRGLSRLLEDRMDRARRLRHGRPERVRRRRHRPGGVHRVRVRVRARADADAAVRRRADQDVLRQRHPLPHPVLRKFRARAAVLDPRVHARRGGSRRDRRRPRQRSGSRSRRSRRPAARSTG